MFEQTDTEIEGISEEEFVDQNDSTDKEQDDFADEELTNGNVNMGKEESGLAENAYLAEEIRAESGLVINMAQVQSINIPAKFSQRKTENGWEITIHSWCKVTINMAEGMRKTETPMLEGDQITKSGEELLVLHNNPADEYKIKRSTSSLALGRDELLENRRSPSPVDSTGLQKT